MTSHEKIYDSTGEAGQGLDVLQRSHNAADRVAFPQSLLEPPEEGVSRSRRSIAIRVSRAVFRAGYFGNGLACLDVGNRDMEKTDVNISYQVGHQGWLTKHLCYSWLFSEERKAEGTQCLYIPEIRRRRAAFTSCSTRCEERLICNHLEWLICHIENQVPESLHHFTTSPLLFCMGPNENSDDPNGVDDPKDPNGVDDLR